METEKLALRIYGLCAGYAGGDPKLAAAMTGRILKRVFDGEAAKSDHELLCLAGKYLTEELSKLPRPLDSQSQKGYAAWSFKGRLLISLQALDGLSKDQRLLLLLRDQWGLGVEDLAGCWQIPSVEMCERLKQASRLWHHQLKLVLARKRRVHEM